MPRMDNDGLATDCLSRFKRQAAMDLGMPMMEITDEFAGMKMVRALMAGDKVTFMAGYTRENAVIAVLERMPTLNRDDLEAELRDQGI